MDIGKRLKEIRLQNDLTLEDLASRSELTKGFLSQVERGLTSPSIATLTDILEALGTNLSDFFHEEEEQQVVYSPQDFFEDEQDDFTIEWVVPGAQNHDMEPILLTLHPHCSSNELSAFKGEEFGYVLKGAVTLIHGSKKYKVKAKETFYLNNPGSHYLYNHGNSDSVIMWITDPPVF